MSTKMYHFIHMII